MLQSGWSQLKTGKKTRSSIDEVKIIETVCSLLEGTFALAIVNTTSLNVYLVRQGSTLYINDKGSYSSIQGKDWVELPEGKVVKLTKEYKFKEVGKFESKSPFFVL
jgi:glucosamine 6-phosphate synthetase-like amidotransferase/phosphosugar isomerase protein